jgi:hypothetical protein
MTWGFADGCSITHLHPSLDVVTLPTAGSRHGDYSNQQHYIHPATTFFSALLPAQQAPANSEHTVHTGHK